MSTWLERGRAFILTLDVPADAKVTEARRIFREHGWRFHGGTCWGRKAWGKATREFLRGRGLIPGPPPAAAFEFRPDIIFPFRNKENQHDRT